MDPLFSVFLSVVLEIADILLFLCIDRNHWQPLFKKIGSFAVYEFKLLIPVRMGFANLEHFYNNDIATRAIVNKLQRQVKQIAEGEYSFHHQMLSIKRFIMSEVSLMHQTKY